MDQWDAKDVWFPTGERARFLDVLHGLQATGYGIRKAEIVQTHAIWLFVLVRAASMNGESVRSHLRNICWRAGVYCFDEDVMIQPTSNRIIVSVQWRIPPRGLGRAEAWERQEEQLQALLDRLP